ncbi:unnamed protein product [Darwinula stevensoni]|uniref:Integrator complex subunit 5 C-terminal domain-containing protein n=1 Tax=Darwinula stevensoni TaxID=69355 RepID=A0A7R8XBC1_9CRUS|nr:unnamed protein product [Darwinula stevensoni]CAG0887628.1 unnamed protein product [Darwinula stevensoni]
MNGASVRGDKVGSVVGILGHLGSSHYGGLKSALVLMFRGIQEDPLKEENLSVVPYIIQLCSMSHLLLQAATDDLPQLLSREMIECLSKQAPQWLGKYFSTAPVLIGMLVNLLLQVETSGPVLIQLLLDLAINPPGRNITLQNIIGETSHLLLSGGGRISATAIHTCGLMP